MNIRENGFIAQSGVIPVRTKNGQMQVALVTTSDGRHWTIPKGHVEADMTARESALKESFEEAGLVGTVSPRQVCAYRHFKGGRQRHVRVFIMQVRAQLRDWPERGRRRRRWMSPERAAMLVRSPELRRALFALSGSPAADAATLLHAAA